MSQKIVVASHAGFCSGVNSAVEKALELAKKYGHIYTLGELVHNELVTGFLHSNNVDCVSFDEIDTLKKGDVVLIRAHGIPKAQEQKLIECGLAVFDATCPVVKRNQSLASESAKKGGVVIVGDAKHDEIVGLKGYAEDAKVISVDKILSADEGELEEIFGFSNESDSSENSAKIVTVLFQTTVLKENFEKIKEKLDNFSKKHLNLLVSLNTICYNTTMRQNEVARLAIECDAVLTLGSRHSANTLRLCEVAKEHNPNVFFAESVDEVKAQAKLFKDFHSVSIVAGASTPLWLIREVTKFMSDTQKTAVNAAEVEVKEAATLQEQPAEPTTMDELMKSAPAGGGYVQYRPGKRVKGTVISADDKGIVVSIGGKKDAFIDKSEATIDGNYNPADYKKGDTVEAIILDVKGVYVTLSKKEIDKQRKEEEEAEKALSAGEFSLVMTEVVKGGLRGHLGQYTIFVPASQIRMGYVSNLEDYKGKTLRLMLMPPKEKPVVEGEEAAQPEAEAKPAKKSRYLFASQRMVLEKEKQEKEDKFWNNIHVNDIVTGKVKRLSAFGAFVSVDGYDCLAHISELSWNRITDPATVLKIGDVKDFVVLKLDREHGKISLGYKQLQPKPYEVAAEKYPVGTVVKGKVERIYPYGAFVSIDDGIDGLVHVSQISHKWIKDANEALTVGQEVEAQIIGFEDTRITLSIKALLPVPEETETAPEGEAQSDEEKSAKRTSRVKKFEQKVADGESAPKKERRSSKKETSSEPKEWVSGSSSASLGDLIKGLNLELPEEEEVEAPKKTTRKKKTEDAE